MVAPGPTRTRSATSELPSMRQADVGSGLNPSARAVSTMRASASGPPLRTTTFSAAVAPGGRGFPPAATPSGINVTARPGAAGRGAELGVGAAGGGARSCDKAGG